MFGSRLLYNPGNTFTITPSTLNVYESQSVVYSVSAPGVSDGTTLYWSTSGTVAAADFSDSTLTGSFTITGGLGSFTRTLINDSTNESAETMIVALRTGSVSGTIVATADTVTVNDGVTLTYGTSLEGTTVTATLTYKTASYVFYWEILYGTATSADFTGSVSGTVTTAASSPYNTTFSINIAADSIDDAGDTYYIQIRDGSSSGNIVYTTPAISITQPTATVTGTPQTSYTDAAGASTYTSNSILEGVAGSFQITMPTYVSATTTLYWTIKHGTTVDADFSALNGSFITANNSGTIYGNVSITAITDAIDDPDTTFQLEIRWGSITGYVMVTSPVITVKQQAVTFFSYPQTSYTDAAGASTYTSNSIVEGGSGNFTIQMNRYWTGSAQTLYWTILHGTTVDADFSAVNGSFTSATGTYGFGNGGAFTVSPTLDSVDDADETFQVQIRWGSTSGYVMATSSVITIKQQAVTFFSYPQTSYTDSAGASTYTSNSIVEGGSGNFTVQMNRYWTGSAQTLYWTILHGTTVDADFTAVSGSFTSATGTYGFGNGGAFTVSPTLDSVDDADETFQVQLRWGSTSGYVMATSSVMTIKQQAVTFFSLPVSNITDSSGVTTNTTNAITEGTSGSFVVQLNRYWTGSAQTLYWTILHGTTVDADFTAVSGSFTSATGTYGFGNAGTFSVSTATDTLDDADETFQVQIRWGSITGYVMLTSPTLTIKQQVFTFNTLPASTYYTGTSTNSTSNAITEGNSGSFLVQLNRYYSTTQTVGWTVKHITTTAADFTVLSGTANTTGTYSFGYGYNTPSVTTVVSGVSKTFQLEMRYGGTSGYVITTSPTITIMPQEAAIITYPGSTYYTGTSAYSTSNAITEGLSGTFFVQVSRSYTTVQTLYWTIKHGTTSDADFSAVSGSVTTSSNITYGTGVNISVTTVTDVVNDADETFQLEIRESSISGPILGTSSAVTIKQQEAAFITYPGSTYYTGTSAYSTSNAITEGLSGTFFVQISRSNNTAQTVYWTIKHGTTSDADFSAVNGYVTTSSNVNYGTGVNISVTTIMDSLDDVDETFQLEIRESSITGRILSTSNAVTIKQQEAAIITYPGSTYYTGQSAYSTSNAITEGLSGTFFVQVSRSNNTVQTLYWTIKHGTTSDADFSAVNGSVTTSSNVNYGTGVNISVTTVTDALNDADETFQLEIRESSITGRILSTSSTVTIKQQEAAIITYPASTYYTGQSAYSTSNAITEGLSGTFFVQISRSNNTAQTVYWTIKHGTTSDADFSAVNGSVTTSSNVNYGTGVNISVTTIMDSLDDVDETFQLEIRESSISGPILVTSNAVTIKQQEVAFISLSSTVSEGAALSVGVQVSRSYNTVQTLYWTIKHGTTSDADFTAVNGSFTTASHVNYGTYGSFSINVATDAVNDPAETFQVEIRYGSITGYVIGTSSAVTVTNVLGTISATPYVSGGLMTMNFQGTDGATTTTVTSGTLSNAVTLNSCTISATHGPASGYTSLRINGPTNGTARAEVTGLSISPTSFTFESWIYHNTFTPATATPNIFSVGVDYMNLLCVRWLSTTTVEFRTNISNSSIAQGGSATASAYPATGVWNHHAITADGTNYKYYLNGALIASTATGTWGYGTTAGKLINGYSIGDWLGDPWGYNGTDAWYWNARLSASVVYTTAFTGSVVKTGMA